MLAQYKKLGANDLPLSKTFKMCNLAVLLGNFRLNLTGSRLYTAASNTSGCKISLDQNSELISYVSFGESHKKY